jgi:hypothetical protein
MSRRPSPPGALRTAARRASRTVAPRLTFLDVYAASRSWWSSSTRTCDKPLPRTSVNHCCPQWGEYQGAQRRPPGWQHRECPASVAT